MCPDRTRVVENSAAGESTETIPRAGQSSGGGSIYGETEMNFSKGQIVLWTPIYFRWDKPALVPIIRIYRCGSALLANGKTTSPDGIVEWDNGTLLGKVTAQ